MIGSSFKLILEKSDKTATSFLSSVVLLSEAPEGMERSVFEDKIASLLNLSAEERTPYNKSNPPRYYGFVDAISKNGKEYLLLTPRGRYLKSMIEPVVSQNDKKQVGHQIRPAFRSAFFSLLLDSMYFDSFGRNNAGVKTSQSDVNPPNVMLRLIHHFGKVTDQEILFGVYALHEKRVATFPDLVNCIQQNRTNSIFWYDEISKWNLSNFLSDFKLPKLLVDFNLLKKEQDARSPSSDWYSLSDDLTDKQKQRVSVLPPYFRPKHLVVSESDIDNPFRWSAVCPMGAVGDTNRIFTIDCQNPNQTKQFDDIFALALAKAFCPLVLPHVNLSRDTFLVLKGEDERRLQELMGAYWPLLDRINDPNDAFNGWSINPVSFKKGYDLSIEEGIKFRCPGGAPISQILPKNQVRIPANLHFICEVKK